MVLVRLGRGWQLACEAEAESGFQTLAEAGQRSPGGGIDTLGQGAILTPWGTQSTGSFLAGIYVHPTSCRLLSKTISRGTEAGGAGGRHRLMAGIG